MNCHHLLTFSCTDSAPILSDTPKDAIYVVVSVSDDFARWKAIASKSVRGIQVLCRSNFCSSVLHWLQNVPTNPKSLIFVEVSSQIKEPSGSSVLRLIYDQVCATLSSNHERQILVILDDITTLEWIGIPTLDLTRFSRALRALCLEVSHSLFLRSRRDTL